MTACLTGLLVVASAAPDLLSITHLLPALVKGGGERAAVDLANWQAEQGHRVTIVAGRHADEALLRNDLDSRIDVQYICRNAGRIGSYLAGLAWTLRRRKWLAEQDVLHAHLTFPAALLTLRYFWQRMRGATKPALIETYHAVGMPIHPLATMLHGWMASKRNALALMADDGQWRDFRARHPQLNVVVIPNGLAHAGRLASDDPALQSYAATAGVESNGRLIVGNVGRIVKERQPERLAKTIILIARKSKGSVDFLIAGDGPERAGIAQIFKEAGLLGHVHTPGLAMDPLKPISLMDLYITLNVGPVTGLAGLQAAQCGVPVIAIQLDDEFQPSAGDWIWSSHDEDEVAAEAVRLLENRALREKLARHQQAYALRNLSVGKMGTAYSDLYASAISAVRKAG